MNLNVFSNQRKNKKVFNLEKICWKFWIEFPFPRHFPVTFDNSTLWQQRSPLSPFGFATSWRNAHICEDDNWQNHFLESSVSRFHWDCEADARRQGRMRYIRSATIYIPRNGTQRGTHSSWILRAEWIYPAVGSQNSRIARIWIIFTSYIMTKFKDSSCHIII